MKTFLGLMFLTLAGVCHSALPGYKYQQPSPVHLPRPLPVQQLPLPQQHSSSGIYSVVPSLPVAQFSVQQQSPQQIYLPPLQPQPLPQPHQSYSAPSQPLSQPQSQSQSFSQSLSQPLPLSPPQQSYLPPRAQQQSQPLISLPNLQSFGQQNYQSSSYNPQPQHHQQQQQQQLQQPQHHQHQQQQQQRTAIITKDIFIHSAPEESDDEPILDQLDNIPIRKNYRIVFIKSPTQSLKSAAAALKRAQDHSEEKTVIYVLSKKADVAELQHQLQQVQQIAPRVNKPEVYFIKYKTPEEAQRAQQEIQAQYDALGGSTHISDEGIAPITSVSAGALKLGAGVSSISSSRGQESLSLPIIGGGASSSSSSHGSSSSYQYLPPQK